MLSNGTKIEIREFLADYFADNSETILSDCMQDYYPDEADVDEEKVDDVLAECFAFAGRVLSEVEDALRGGRIGR